jgi:hypothetical protein
MDEPAPNVGTGSLDGQERVAGGTAGAGGDSADGDDHRRCTATR